MVCVRRPRPSIEGRRTSRVWEVESTTNSILVLALGGDLVALEVERVVLESTSDQCSCLHERRCRLPSPIESPSQTSMRRRQPRRLPTAMTRSRSDMTAHFAIDAV